MITNSIKFVVINVSTVSSSDSMPKEVAMPGYWATWMLA
jgi:hypothetical protein